MQDVLIKFSIFFFSTLFGIIITLIFEEPLKRQQKKLKAWWLRLKTKLFPKKGSTQNFTVGRWSADWYVVEGSSSSYYRPENVEVFLEQGTFVTKDSEIKRRMAEVADKQEKLRQKGEFSLHDGPTLALFAVKGSQTGDYEDPVLKLHLKRSNYFMFAATVNRLDEEYQTEDGITTTLRKHYFLNTSLNKPIPQLASVFAIQMALITADGYFVITKRAAHMVGYPNFLAPALNESVNAIQDIEAGKISLVKTVKRAAMDEMNIEVNEDEIRFFTLGVDTKEYMYTLTGVIDCKILKAEDLRILLSTGAKEGKEYSEIYYLGPSVSNCARQMRELSMKEKWAPYGIVCLVQAMIYKSNSFKAVKDALTKFPPFPSENFTRGR